MNRSGHGPAAEDGRNVPFSPLHPLIPSNHPHQGTSLRASISDLTATQRLPCACVCACACAYRKPACSFIRHDLGRVATSSSSPLPVFADLLLCLLARGLAFVTLSPAAPLSVSLVRRAQTVFARPLPALTPPLPHAVIAARSSRDTAGRNLPEKQEAASSTWQPRRAPSPPPQALSTISRPSMRAGRGRNYITLGTSER